MLSGSDPFPLKFMRVGVRKAVVKRREQLACGMWYSLRHCRPCFLCRVLLHSVQVAQLENEPGTSWWPLVLLRRTFSLSFSSLSLSFPFSFCCCSFSFSRFLPCKKRDKVERRERLLVFFLYMVMELLNGYMVMYDINIWKTKTKWGQIVSTSDKRGRWLIKEQ